MSNSSHRNSIKTETDSKINVWCSVFLASGISLSHLNPIPRRRSPTSVVNVVNDVELVLHRGAVGAAEAAGEEEEEERRGCGQPEARRDSEADVGRSAGQHPAGSPKALQRTGGDLLRLFLPGRTAENSPKPQLLISWYSLTIKRSKGKTKTQKQLLTLNFGNGLRSASRGPMLLLSRRAPTYILMLLVWLQHHESKASVSISDPRPQDVSPPPLLTLLPLFNPPPQPPPLPSPQRPFSHPLSGTKKKEALVLASS